jgi:peptidylprolyl isomerase
MTEPVKPGDVVAINYVGRLEVGTVFEAGSPNVISGMSKAVVGMQVGEEKTIEIPPEESYGERKQELLVKVQTQQLPDDAKEGDILSDGQPGSPQWVVVERDDAETVLDGNHPLAGKTLIFDVTLVGIQ